MGSQCVNKESQDLACRKWDFSNSIDLAVINEFYTGDLMQM